MRPAWVICGDLIQPGVKYRGYATGSYAATPGAPGGAAAGTHTAAFNRFCSGSPAPAGSPAVGPGRLRRRAVPGERGVRRVADQVRQGQGGPGQLRRRRADRHHRQRRAAERGGSGQGPDPEPDRGRRFRPEPRRRLLLHHHRGRQPPGRPRRAGHRPRRRRPVAPALHRRAPAPARRHPHPAARRHRGALPQQAGQPDDRRARQPAHPGGPRRQRPPDTDRPVFGPPRSSTGSGRRPSSSTAAGRRSLRRRCPGAETRRGTSAP